MMFPIVTWFLDIGVFLGTNAKFEEGLDCPPSAIRLIGRLCGPNAAPSEVALRAECDA